MHNFNNIICRSLTVGCLINTNRQQHQLAATAPTGSRQQPHQQAAGSNSTNWQQAAGTVLLDITNCISF